MSFLNIRRLTVGVALAAACTPVLAENLTPDLQFNGYATAGAAWTQNAKGDEYLLNPSAINAPGITNDPSMDFDSVVGLQFNYRLNDQTHLVTQLVANATNGDFAVKANWAYISYDLTDNLSVQAGRLAFPTFLYSNNLNVGEAWPWARLPAEVYDTVDGIQSLNGVQMIYNHPIGDWNLAVQPLIGDGSLAAEQSSKIRGLTVNFSNDNLTLHAGTQASDITINFTGSGDGQGFISNVDAGLTAGGMAAAIPSVNAQMASTLNISNVYATDTDFGALYDDGHWFAAAEYAQIRAGSWIQNYNAGYASVGHYFGQFLPYVLYSRINDVAEQKSQDNLSSLGTIGAALAQSQHKDEQTLSLGVRYQLHPGVSLKAQIDRVNGFQGTNGLFVPVTASAPALGTVYVYSLSLNTSF